MTHENCSVGGTASDCACVHIHADFEVPISCLARAKKNILKRNGKKEGGECGGSLSATAHNIPSQFVILLKETPSPFPSPVDLNRKQP